MSTIIKLIEIVIWLWALFKLFSFFYDIQEDARASHREEQLRRRREIRRR